ncbi:MAG: TlyA family RNA methyltransferase [Firmicutes bacterium]|nr:TlyA family RNA methyltransferase [Bacillota bacterium]
MKHKTRLDLLLVERGLFPSREQARAAIMAGEVLVDDIKQDKAGAQVDENCTVRLLGQKLPYVSRGGLKLEKAIAVFGLELRDKTVLDIGSSTGGFTDCCLQNGAARVYAVDVGTNQLAWKLRSDPRVTVLEKTNARLLDRSIIDDDVDLIVADVSFISLTLALPAAVRYQLKEGGQVMCLIKPQFEAGREAVGKGGIVRDAAIHRRVIEKIAATFTDMGLAVRGLDYSPITGADGNIEYLIHGEKGGVNTVPDIDAVIAAAWREHKGRTESRPE